MISVFKFLTVTLIAVFVVACGGGGGSPGVTPGGTPAPPIVVRPLFTSAASQITLSPGISGAQIFVVGGGTGPYIATSSNAAVVAVALSAEGLKLTGLSVGSANILIIDSNGATANIAVTVPTVNNLVLFTTAPAVISILVGEKPTYSLGGGSPPYSVASSNAAVVSAGVSGNSLTVNAVAAGTANLVIRDSVGGIVIVAATVPAPANVALFTTAPSAITVAIGAAPGFVVGGGSGSYTAATSNASVAVVSLNGGFFTVTGLAVGSSNIVIRDSFGATVTIPVTVPAAGTLAFFTTAPSSITVGIGAEPEYDVGGGSGPYSASTSNASIAVAKVVGTKLSIRGIGTGTANVVVRDSTGALVTIAVSVGSTPLAITPNSATGIIGDTLVATLTGGTPPFRVSVGNILVANASMSGNTLTIKLQQVGQTVVTVLDVNDQSIAYSLTVNAATPGIRLSPNPLVISEKGIETVSLTVFGASAGPIEVFSSDVSKLVATINNATRVVSVTTPTNRCVDADTPVTITVVDSSRATGVATITIKDNGVTCP